MVLGPALIRHVGFAQPLQNIKQAALAGIGTATFSWNAMLHNPSHRQSLAWSHWVQVRLAS